MRNANRAVKKKEPSIEQEFNPLLTLQEDLNKTMTHFYDLFEPANFNLDHFDDLQMSPMLDIIETKKEFHVEVEMPGLDEKNIKVTVDENTLTIFGEKLRTKHSHSRFVDREIKYGRYERCISLPKGADWEHVSANFENGILTVLIPKINARKSNPKAVKIDAHKDHKS